MSISNELKFRCYHRFGSSIAPHFGIETNQYITKYHVIAVKPRVVNDFISQFENTQNMGTLEKQ